MAGPATKNFTVYRNVPRMLRFTMTAPGSVLGWTTLFTVRTDENAIDYIFQVPGTVIEAGSATVPGVFAVPLAKEDLCLCASGDYAYSFLRTNENAEDVLALATMRVKENIRDRSIAANAKNETLYATLQAVTPGDAVVAAVGQRLAMTLVFNRALQVIGTAPITLTVRSSAPFVHGDEVLIFDVSHSQLTAVVFAGDGVDLTGADGLTFTADDATARTGWSQLRDRETAQPIADTLGSLTGVLAVLGPG